MEESKILSCEKPAEKDIIFGLDIGTRSVIGIVGIREGDILKVLSWKKQEHEKRAMTDGQIEDIEKVRKAVSTVRRALEEELEINLTNVSVAAAGRALKVETASAEAKFPQKTEITTELIEKLRNEAIDHAIGKLYDRLEEKEQNMSFYCVGNSIIRQTLDGYEYNNLNEHKGNNISIEVIATFLPGSVVESLYAVIEGCNMEISHMTLEPIAAMNALIPKDLRALNLALVDIGAGTSDIAVSKAGTILSYEMVTTAGDEITDSIVSSLLVDFDTAERLKRELSTGKNEFPYEDILKFQHEITREELLTIVGEAVEKMCSEICDTILKVNGAAPAAVFLVGGGSQIPDLTGRVAQKLGIPENKVALGNTPYFREMKNEAKNLVGPEFMTPLGIVITSFTEKKTKPKTVLLNGDAIKIFDEKNLTVTSVLISAGIPLRSLVGTPGQSIHFKLNGEERVLRGSVSIPSQITVNGEGAAVTTACKTNDVINIIFPENGITPIVTIGAYLKNPPESFVYYKEKQIRIGTVVKKSGEIVPYNTQISEGDSFEFEELRSLEDIAALIPKEDNEVYLINSVPSADNAPICNGDLITALDPESAKLEKAKAMERGEIKGLRVYINGKEQLLPNSGQTTPYIFAEALNFVDLDLSNPQGIPVLTINGQNAGYSDIIKENDSIEIRIK